MALTKNQAIKKFQAVCPQGYGRGMRVVRAEAWDRFIGSLYQEGAVTYKQFSTWENIYNGLPYQKSVWWVAERAAEREGK